MIGKRATLAFAVWVVCLQTGNSASDDQQANNTIPEIRNLHILQDDSLGDDYSNITSHQTINLTIYFEALDTHSINFFKNQLKRVFLKLHREMSVRLVPYGRAKTITGRTTVCEHGRDECALNRVLACALEMLRSEEDQVVYSTCVLTAGVSILKEPCNCAQRVGLTWGRINNCATGTHGEKLLRRMGEQTPRAVASRKLPMIEINGTYDPDKARAMLRNFEKFVCKWLDYPAGCDHKLADVNDDEYIEYMEYMDMDGTDDE